MTATRAKPGFSSVGVSTAVFIMLSVVLVEGRQCYWCGPLAEQVHRSRRAPPCHAGSRHVALCEPGYDHCATVATSPPHVESRYCVKIYQDECYPLFCNSTRTWKMTCPCRGDLCNGPNTEHEMEAFAVLSKLVTKTRIKKRAATLTDEAKITDAKIVNPDDVKELVDNSLERENVLMPNDDVEMVNDTIVSINNDHKDEDQTHSVSTTTEEAKISTEEGKISTEEGKISTAADSHSTIQTTTLSMLEIEIKKPHTIINNNKDGVKEHNIGLGDVSPPKQDQLSIESDNNLPEEKVNHKPEESDHLQSTTDSIKDLSTDIMSKGDPETTESIPTDPVTLKAASKDLADDKTKPRQSPTAAAFQQDNIPETTQKLLLYSTTTTNTPYISTYASTHVRTQVTSKPTQTLKEKIKNHVAETTTNVAVIILCMLLISFG